MAQLLPPESTTFTLDHLGRYLCNSLPEALDSAGQTTDHNSSIVTVQGNLEDALAAPLVTLSGDKGSTQVNSTDLWCNNK